MFLCESGFTDQCWSLQEQGSVTTWAVSAESQVCVCVGVGVCETQHVLLLLLFVSCGYVGNRTCLLCFFTFSFLAPPHQSMFCCFLRVEFIYSTLSTEHPASIINYKSNNTSTTILAFIIGCRFWQLSVFDKPNLIILEECYCWD
jgi:hypothetical protein